MKQPITLQDYMRMNSEDQERILNICIQYKYSDSQLPSVVDYMNMFGIPKNVAYTMNVRERIEQLLEWI